MNDKTNSNNLIKEQNTEQKSVDQLQDVTNEDLLQKKKNPKLSRQEYEDKLNYLQQKYTKCFTCPPSPLAIEINKELHILEKNIISKTKINRILARYVRSKDYRKALIENADRLNLTSGRDPGKKGSCSTFMYNSSDRCSTNFKFSTNF